MAKPIRNTPMLYGDDAKQFFLDIANIPSKSERANERLRIKKSVAKLKELIEEYRTL